MGEAKKRGSFTVRQQEAMERDKNKYLEDKRKEEEIEASMTESEKEARQSTRKKLNTMIAISASLIS